ncbi:MAG: hypothetical protein KGI50_07155, partial [Patescibacteria group bacterium]|nr:hypothetical protein [Patescibacteria group bacterium]
PRSISSVNFLVQSVTTTVVEPASEVLTFQINFGQNTKLSNVLSRYILPTTLYLPQDTAQSPLPQDITAVGSTFLSDLDSIVVTNISSTGIELDLGVTPVTGAQVRNTDLNWTNVTTATGDLIGTFTSQFITLNRTNENQTWYIRQVNGTQTSRYTSVVHLTAPLLPAAPNAVISFTPSLYNPNTSPTSPLVALGLNGIQTDVEGVEIRAADNATVVYRHQYLSTIDLQFNYDNTGTLSRTVGFWCYTFNAFNDYSAGTFVQATLPQPPAPVISITQSQQSIGMLTVNVDQLTNHPVKSVTVQVSATGASGGVFNDPTQVVTVDGQPTTINVQISIPAIYWVRAKRNDYLGDSPWSNPIKVDQTGIPAAMSTENIVPSGGYDFSRASVFFVSGNALIETNVNRAFMNTTPATVGSFFTSDGTSAGSPTIVNGQDLTFSLSIQTTEFGGHGISNSFTLTLLGNNGSSQVAFATINVAVPAVASAQYWTFYLYIRIPASGNTYGLNAPWSWIFSNLSTITACTLTGYSVTRGRLGASNTPPLTDGGSAGTAGTTLGFIGTGANPFVVYVPGDPDPGGAGTTQSFT